VTRTNLWLRSTRGAVLALCLLGVSHVAWAEDSDTTTEGVVVALEKDDIIIDLAGKRGAAAGDVVEIWRPLKLKHPVTGKIVTDRFLFGSLKLMQVRDRLSIARAEGRPSRVIQPGDIVVLHKVRLDTPAKPKPKPPAVPLKKQPEAPKPEPEQPAVGVVPAEGTGTTVITQAEDPDTALVADMFDQLKGADLTRRIIAYEDYVRQNPEGRYAVVLWEEAAQLRRLLANDAVEKAEALPRLENFDPPRETLHGIPLTIGIEVSGPARGAVLYARRAGEVAYQPAPMKAAGPGYFSVTLPATRMRSPSVEYFIEATTADGKSHQLVATTEEPKVIDVQAIPSPTPPVRAEATASIWTDFADYNQMKGNDRVWQTEGFVGMRFGDEGLRALRTGFGVFRGVGGSLEDLDEKKLSARKVGLTYGYLEAEAGVSNFTGLIFRGVVGLRDDGITGGAQALVRIGNDKKTNLQLGGEVLGGVGLRGITQLEFNGIEKVPMLFRTEVTNQPAGVAATADSVHPDDPTNPDGTSLEVGEIGARAIVQVGYRILPTLVVAGRGSYQGRNIKHAGPGFGGAVTYTW
jgi:hypothetical protein